jgi:hypothetical protein
MKKILKYIGISSLIVGCGSGESSSSGGSNPPDAEVFKPSTYNKQAIKGIIDYDAIDAKHFYAKQAIKIKNKNIQNQSLNATSTVTTCANLTSNISSSWQSANAVTSDVFSTLGVVTGFASLIPAITLPATAVSGGVGGVSYLYNLFAPQDNSASMVQNCLVQDELIMQNEIIAIESQIAGIESSVTALQSNFRNLSYQVALNQVNSNQETLNNALSMFLPINQSITFTDQLFMLSGLLNKRYSSPTGNTIESSANYLNMRDNVDDLVVSQSINFQNSVDALSGTYIPASCSDNCFAQVQIDPNSPLITAYNSTYNNLKVHLNDYNSIYTDGSAYSRILDDYNNTIMSVYIQSAYALNSAYMAEWLVNKMNYMAYAQNATPEFTISSLGGFNDTYYDYVGLNLMGESADFVSNTNSYNNAQLQLQKLYSARLNAMYTTMLNYIVSDNPSVTSHSLVTGQTLYTTVESNGYAVNLYPESSIAEFNQTFVKNLGAKTASPQSLILNSSLTNGWGTLNESTPQPYSGALYQYGGLRSLDCLNQFESIAFQGNVSNKSLNANSCPAIFADVDGNPINKALYLPNQSLQPYMLESNLQFKLSESVTNNIAACNLSQGNLYFWHPQTIQNNPMNNESSSYLMCSWWNPPPAMTPSGGGSGGAINGAYGYFVGYEMFQRDPNGNYNGGNLDSRVQASVSVPGNVGMPLYPSVDVPMTLTAGDVTGVPEYGSNNILMTAPGYSTDITYYQTVFIGENYYTATQPPFSFNGTPQQNGATAGFIVNLVHPLSEGLNLPIGLGFFGKNNNFFVAPACAFNVPVLVNSVNGMIPICDYSTNINLYDGITGETISYYGNQYNDFPTTGYYVAGSYPYAGVTRSDGVFVPMVSLFNGRRSILIEGILAYDPYFTMDFQ